MYSICLKKFTEKVYQGTKKKTQPDIKIQLS